MRKTGMNVSNVITPVHRLLVVLNNFSTDILIDIDESYIHLIMVELRPGMPLPFDMGRVGANLTV
jgi:hypothetical protein